MTWYKTGTVQVTLNSDTVVGTGTAFIANARVGDAFSGPDGNWYEVINIVSNTSLGIYPNYRGASVASGGTYIIAPMEGYVKDSADALRAATQVIGQFGSTKANSGANNDITSLSGLTTPLSTSQGGTGSNTQAGARINLGLGSVSVEDIVPISKGGTGANTKPLAQSALGLVPVTSASDLTIGRLVVPGWQGYGGSLRAIASTDFNSLPTLSLKFIGQSTTNGPETGDFYIDHEYYDGNNARVTATSITTGNSYYRVKVGLWSAWKMCYNSVNAVGNITAGAIIEQGSNANGTYTRFSDGTLICVGVINSRAVGISTTNGSAFNSTVQSRTTHPYPFISTPFQILTVVSTTDAAVLWSSNDLGSTIEFRNYYLFAFTSGTRNIQTQSLSIGRWK